MSREHADIFLRAALECAAGLCPEEPGLTHEEIIKIGLGEGYYKNDVQDAWLNMSKQSIFTDKNGSCHTKMLAVPWTAQFLYKNPDYRNLAAFDFLYSWLNFIFRADVTKDVKIERSVIVELAATRDIPRADMEAALTVATLSGHIIKDGHLLRPVPDLQYLPPPGSRHDSLACSNARERKIWERAYSVVKQIIEQRKEGFKTPKVD